MKVKCRGCGSLVEREKAYRRTVNGKNAYWCSEQEYNRIEDKKKNGPRVISLVEDIFGHPIEDPELKKEKKKWNALADDEVILSYLRTNKEKLMKSMSKPFQSERNKIRYFSAIIKNSISEYIVPQEVVVDTCSDMEFYQPKQKPYQPRRGFAEIEEDA